MCIKLSPLLALPKEISWAAAILCIHLQLLAPEGAHTAADVQNPLLGLLSCYSASSSPQQWLPRDPPARHWQPAKKDTLWSRSLCTHDFIAAYPCKQNQKVKLLHLVRGWNSPFHCLQTHPWHPGLHHTLLTHFFELIATHCFDNDSSSLHNLTSDPQLIRIGPSKSDGSEITETNLERKNLLCPFR